MYTEKIRNKQIDEEPATGSHTVYNVLIQLEKDRYQP